jgi:hypothetical protein
VPTIERRLVLGGARRAVAARRHHLTRRVVAEVLRDLGRTTKQLGCVSNDGVVDLDLARLVRARLPLARVFSFSYIITRVAPHCVNTLRILHAALSLSLSLSLEPAQSSNIPYCPHCGPPCNPATVSCNPWRVTFLHFSTLRFCTSRRLLVDWSLIVANLDRRPARTHQRAPCTPPCCLANATPPLTTP